MGEDGYLAAKGLVPLPADERAEAEEAAKALDDHRRADLVGSERKHRRGGRAIGRRSVS